ncbi:hypothetical protein B566_EDAN016939 [Ephemera danica]|nr:hypothetical protein B566_EDAN016939 [Ephemera danica]
MLPWRDGVILYLLPIFTFQHWGRALASKAPPTWVKQPPTGEIFFQAMPPGKVTLDCVAKVLMGDPALTHYQHQGTRGRPARFVLYRAKIFATSHAALAKTIRKSVSAVWYRENSPALHEIKDDDGRLTLDSNGTLWFSYVVMNDKTVDFTYVCTAQIPGQQTLVVGHRVSMLVTKKRKQTRYRRPALQFASSDVQTSIQGSQVKLYCIYDGKPNPEVVWRKGNQHLIPHEYDDRLSLRSKGKILMINNVTTADEGNYICVANNSAGEAPPQSVFLDVQVLPYFTVEPTTVTARQGEKVEIRCEAAGDPMPTITWTKNGIYTPALSGQKVVTFHSAKVTDTGNFGCNASSEIGHVYKDIAINILGEISTADI